MYMHIDYITRTLYMYVYIIYIIDIIYTYFINVYCAKIPGVLQTFFVWLIFVATKSPFNGVV